MPSGWGLLTSNVDGGWKELQRLGVKFAVGRISHGLVGAILSLPDVWKESAAGQRSKKSPIEHCDLLGAWLSQKSLHAIRKTFDPELRGVVKASTGPVTRSGKVDASLGLEVLHGGDSPNDT